MVESARLLSGYRCITYRGFESRPVRQTQPKPKIMRHWLKPTGLVLLVLLLFSGARAHSLDEYLKLRRDHGVSGPAGTESLLTLVGESVVEISARVTGFSQGQAGQVLILSDNYGGQLFLRSSEVPDWLRSGVHARMLVRAQRASEHGLLDAVMIAAITESEIARQEQAELARVQAQQRQAPPSVPNAPALQTPPPNRQRPANWTAGAEEALPIYAAFIKQRNPRLTDAVAYQIAEGIIGHSIQFGVDARLIMAMVMVESGFRPEAVSRSGAQGLGQLMPATARGLGVRNSFDINENLYGTTRLIRGHIERYQEQTGDAFEGLVLALAAYNAGSGNVRRHGGVPPFRETQNYIQKVIELYRQLTGEN